MGLLPTLSVGLDLIVHISGMTMGQAVRLWLLPDYNSKEAVDSRGTTQGYVGVFLLFLLPIKHSFPFKTLPKTSPRFYSNMVDNHRI